MLVNEYDDGGVMANDPGINAGYNAPDARISDTFNVNVPST